MIDADIERLVIDPTRVSGSLMFRLAESVSGIVVHESIRDGLLAAGFHTLSFLRPEEWVG